MLKKVILALAVMGLVGAAAGTASAQGYGRGGYCYGPRYYQSYRPYSAGYYSYRGPSSYFGPRYGYGYGGYRGYGGYGGYGGRSGFSLYIGF